MHGQKNFVYKSTNLSDHRRYRDYPTCWMKNVMFDYRQRQEMFLFPRNQTDSWTHLASFIKTSGCAADPLSQCIAEVKNLGSYTAKPQTPSRRNA